MSAPQIVTPRQLPDPCHSVTVYDAIDPATLTPLQRVAVDAILADLDMLDSRIIECLRLIKSIGDTQRETDFPYDVAGAIDAATLLQLIPAVREEFQERFKRVLRPWWEESYQRRKVADQVMAELRDAG